MFRDTFTKAAVVLAQNVRELSGLNLKAVVDHFTDDRYPLRVRGVASVVGHLYGDVERVDVVCGDGSVGFKSFDTCEDCREIGGLDSLRPRFVYHQHGGPFYVAVDVRGNGFICDVPDVAGGSATPKDPCR